MLRATMLCGLASGASAFGLASVSPLSSVRRMSSPEMSFFDFKATKIDGSEVSMADYKGKPTLILNVASL